MTKGFYILMLATLLSPFWTARTRAETIDFGASFQPLPYAEDGLTFTNLGTSLANVSAGGGDAYLVGGTNFDPIRVRATSATPFDLVSLDVEIIFQAWRVETSLGGLLPLTGPATLDFTSQSGFQGITYFELIHDPAQPNGFINVDNIVINYVPEPSSRWLVTIGGGALFLSCLHRRQRTKHPKIVA